MTTRTTASRELICAISRRTRSSGRCLTRAAATASSFVTENTEYISSCATRFSIPFPKGRVADPKDYEKEFNSVLSGIKVDPKTGEMNLAFADSRCRRFDFDLGSTGKGPSSGWALLHDSTTPRWRMTLFEVNSTQKDRDLCAIVNWKAAVEQAVADGKAHADGRRAGASIRRKYPGILVLRRDRQVAARHGCRSERQVDRCGREAAAVDDGAELRKDARPRLRRRTFEGDFRGIPILKYESRGRRRSASRPRPAAHAV